MKFLHLADTHLGYSAYRKVTEDGVNLREMDVYDAFVRCIDYAVKTKPDVVLHAGDLFDSVRPTSLGIMRPQGLRKLEIFFLFSSIFLMCTRFFKITMKKSP